MIREALEKLHKALLSDAPTGPQKTIAGDDTIYHLDGQKMYHAINAVREARAALTSSPPGDGKLREALEEAGRRLMQAAAILENLGHPAAAIGFLSDAKEARAALSSGRDGKR